MIRKSFLLFTVLITSSCVSQSNQIQVLEGSWAPVVDKMIMEEYIEVYYTDSEVFYYESGLGMTSGDYKVNNGRFSTKMKTSSSFKEKSNVSIKNDTLIFDLDKISVKYYRVNGTGLGDFLDGKIDEETFIEAFENRLKKW